MVHVAVRDAKVVEKRRVEVLEMAADLVNEFEADLAVRGTSSGVDFEAAVGEAEPCEARRALLERAIQELRAFQVSAV